MIKNYLELSLEEIELVYNFMEINREDKVSIRKMDRELRNEMFDFGRGTLFKFYNEKVIAKIAIVLKEAAELGKAYILSLEVDKDVVFKKMLVVEMINHTEEIAREYGAKEIYLGVWDEEIIKILNSLSLYKQYSAVKMSLTDRKIRCGLLNLVHLSESNKSEYVRIYNDAFRDISNGATLTEKQVNKNLEVADDENCFFLVTMDRRNIGIFQCNIRNGEAEFDIGLQREFRGKGYGKMLLETSIDFLNSKHVDKISLVVITKNEIAYEMYKKRGFQECQLISHWFRVGSGLGGSSSCIDKEI